MTSTSRRTPRARRRARSFLCLRGRPRIGPALQRAAPARGVTLISPRVWILRSRFVGALLVAGVVMIAFGRSSDAGAPHLYEATHSDTLLTPDSVTLPSAPNALNDATFQFGASALLSQVPEGSRVLWSSTDSLVATVNQNGLVVGHAPGLATVGAEVSGRHAWAAVTVVPASDTAIRLIAHRGFMRRFPENTLVAVRGAFDNGADAVEVDIRLSSDAVPVVMHDVTVDRTTNGIGAVASLSLAQLSTLNACVRTTTGTWPPCAVPTMRDVLTEARGRGGVLLHLYGTYTPADLRRILDVVHELDMDRKTIFISFDLPTLGMLRQLDPVAPLGYLNLNLAGLDEASALGRAGVAVSISAALADPTIARILLSEATRRRVSTCAWAAIDQAQARSAADLGFRCLMADVPIDTTGLVP